VESSRAPWLARARSSTRVKTPGIIGCGKRFVASNSPVAVRASADID
jgi:hypothetical protein